MFLRLDFAKHELDFNLRATPVEKIIPGYVKNTVKNSVSNVACKLGVLGNMDKNANFSTYIGNTR